MTSVYINVAHPDRRLTDRQTRNVGLRCRDEILAAVHLLETYCILFYCMVVKSGTCLLPICTKLMSLGITVSEIFFNTCWRESAKPLLHYCNTMSASLLIDQRKILFFFIKRLFVEAMLC